MLIFGLSDGVEVLHNVVKRSGAKPPQAGSPMGFLNVCLAFVTFFTHPISLAFKCYFVQTGVL